MSRFKPEPPPPPVADRPLCPACRKPLRPYIVPVYEQRDDGYLGQRVGSTWKGAYDAYGAFCTLRCCQNYANVVYRDRGLILVNEKRSR